MNDATQGTAPPPVTAPEGEFTDSDSIAVNGDELLVLARIAGLPIGEDRATSLARELSNTRVAVAELDRLLKDQPTLVPGAFAPFDPAWPAAAAAPAPASDVAGTTGAGR